MGVSIPCPFAKCSYMEDGFDSIIVKSIDLKNEDLEPTIPKSGNMTIEACVSFERKDMDQNIASTNTLAFDRENKEQCLQSALVDPKHMDAAVKLQKVYKSFRTRRKLADCAILIEQNWWKLLDFAELKHSSISFFDIEKHETAISRWSRARTRAAKVGKGLSKDAKAQKLALQHWLEAIDPRHRYGHNLHFYYDKWLKSESREPFFYWLDIGEGKKINLVKCPRSKLQQQCVKYLGPMERLPYEVVVEDGKLLYKQSREFLHTTREGSRAKWIFVLSTSKTLYVGKKKKGSFQHSSFLAGGATSCAGRLVVEHGVLEAVWPHSGHYRPTEENFKEFISFLQENNVDLSNVKMTSVDEVDDLSSPRKRGHPRSQSSQEDLTGDMSGLEDEVEDPIAEKANFMETLVAPKTRQFQNFGRELTNLQIPKRGQMLGGLDGEKGGASSESFQMDSSTTNGQETPQAFSSDLDHNFSDPNHAETNPKVSISKRDTSQKEMKSYQLGKKLSCKWTTGAGPRIGCVRDYPCELQFLALEHVNLSPRNGCPSKELSRRKSVIPTIPMSRVNRILLCK